MNKLKLIDNTQKSYKKLAKINAHKGWKYDKRAARRAGNINGRYINKATEYDEYLINRDLEFIRHYVTLASLFTWAYSPKGHNWYRNIHARACKGCWNTFIK